MTKLSAVSSATLLFAAVSIVGAQASINPGVAHDKGTSSMLATGGTTVQARNGADNAGGDRGGRGGRGEGAGHASLTSGSGMLVARNGADDGAGHNAGDDHGGARGGHGGRR